MHIVTQLGLMFRATVLNQLTAKVKLATSQPSHARFSAALTGIANREDQLAARFSQGRLSLGQLQQQAQALARQDVMLYGRSTQVDCKPTETASAFHRVLIRTHLQAAGATDAASRQALKELLDPVRVRTQARQMLADAFWAGHLADPQALLGQVRKQAHHEAVGADGPREVRKEAEGRAVAEILRFIAEKQPTGPDALWASMRSLLQSVGAATGGHAATPEPGRERLMPASWGAIASAFWSDPQGAEFASFSGAAVARAVEESLDPGQSDQHHAETRCRRTFEMIEFIRAREPACGHLDGQMMRSILDAYADRLEGDAIDRLIAGNGDTWLGDARAGYRSPPESGIYTLSNGSLDDQDSDNWPQGDSGDDSSSGRDSMSDVRRP